jgi:hypothetical protein
MPASLLLTRLGSGLIQFLKVFVLWLVAIGIWIGLNSLDGPAVDDSALLGQLRQVKPEENGYEILAYLGKSDFRLLSEKDQEKLRNHVDGKEWDQPFVDKILAGRELLFADIEASLKRPYFAFPENQLLDFTTNYSSFIDAARLLQIHSRNLFRQGDYEQSIAVLKTLLVYSGRIKTEENAFLLSYMIGMRMQAYGLDWAHHILSSGRLDEKKLRALLTVVENVDAYGDESFVRIFAGEYKFTKGLIGRMFTESLSHRYENFIQSFVGFSDENGVYDGSFYNAIMFLLPHYYFKESEYQRIAVEFYSTIQKNVPKYCNSLDFPEYQAHEPELMDLIRPNSGMDTIEFSPETWQGYFYRICLFHTYADAVKTAIAIELYNKREGKFPDTLDQLLPTYLAAMPRDYFDGQPLRYAPDKKWIYSIGADFKDDGGSEEGFYAGRCLEEDACYNSPTVPVKTQEQQPVGELTPGLQCFPHSSALSARSAPFAPSHSAPDWLAE